MGGGTQSRKKIPSKEKKWGNLIQRIEGVKKGKGQARTGVLKKSRSFLKKGRSRGRRGKLGRTG